MKISYQDGLDPAYTADHPFNFNCIYCGTKLVYEKTNKASRFSFRDFKRKFLAEQITLLEIEPGDDLPDDYFEIERKHFNYQETQFGRCPLCGWWKLTEEYLAIKDNLWQVFLELAGAIKNFELTDLGVPIDEVRSFLTRKYEHRFQLHPRLLEEVVASVFSDLGYQSICTAYSNDGGIDVVLSGKDEPVAVQVKRYKNKITVEQIRSFPFLVRLL